MRIVEPLGMPTCHPQQAGDGLFGDLHEWAIARTLQQSEISSNNSMPERDSQHLQSVRGDSCTGERDGGRFAVRCDRAQHRHRPSK